MADSTFDFQQIIKLSDNITYPPLSKGENLIITPDTFTTVWCDNNHPTTERASKIYEHLMDNALLFICPVCKLVKEAEANQTEKPSQKFMDEYLKDSYYETFKSKVYVDFVCFFVLLVVLLFYFTF